MAAQQNQINLGKKYCIPLQGMVSWLPFYIIPRSIWDHCPISSGISNTILLHVCGGCQETGAFWTSALWDIVKYWKRCQISTSAQFSCYGVEFRFKLTQYRLQLSFTLSRRTCDFFVNQPQCKLNPMVACGTLVKVNVSTANGDHLMWIWCCCIKFLQKMLSKIIALLLKWMTVLNTNFEKN